MAAKILKFECTTKRSPIAGLGKFLLEKTQVCKLICLRTENEFLDLKEISPV